MTTSDGVRVLCFCASIAMVFASILFDSVPTALGAIVFIIISAAP